jgi:hypothetical protein
MLAATWEPLPAIVAMSVLVLAALTQYFLGRVLNALTLPAILAGWGFAGYVGFHNPSSHALMASLVATGLALVLMLSFYRSGSLGAGCVKAQMAFAAWIGAAIPLLPAMVLVVGVTVAGLAITYCMARVAVADVPCESQYEHEFPAQVTLSLTAIVGTLASWIISHPI